VSPVKALIEELRLVPHPEGGWYRETWRAETGGGSRAAATAILFLLLEGEKSHWHKVDATEIWLWHAGGTLTLRTAEDDAGPMRTVRLGPGVPAGEIPQHIIAPHCWQSAEAAEGWTLVSCVVSPAFEFAGFTLAPPLWSPGQR